MEDIEIDCAVYFFTKKHTMDDQTRNDSGLGSLSLGYISGDLNTPSLNLKEDTTGPTRLMLENSEPRVFSLESSLSKLNISSSCKSDSDRCDSGVDDEKLFESTESVTKPENCHWVSTHFSTEQILDIFKGDEDGDNHLHMSIIHGIPEVTMQIIGLALDWDWLNHTNNLLQTPLHIAVITRQLPVIRRLMCAGASVDVRDQMGNTPLHNACRLGYEDVVRTLMKPVEHKETLQNKYEIPYQRLPQDLESRNYEGLTCLHLAAIGGHINVMELLLEVGANVNAVEGKSGKTVLHFAVDWGNMTMIKFLLSQQNIDINARTYAGLPPILLAYGRGNVDVMDELYSRGAICESLSLSEESDDEFCDERMAEEPVCNRQYAVMSH